MFCHFINTHPGTKRAWKHVTLAESGECAFRISAVGPLVSGGKTKRDWAESWKRPDADRSRHQEEPSEHRLNYIPDMRWKARGLGRIQTAPWIEWNPHRTLLRAASWTIRFQRNVCKGIPERGRTSSAEAGKGQERKTFQPATSSGGGPVVNNRDIWTRLISCCFFLMFFVFNSVYIIYIYMFIWVLDSFGRYIGIIWNNWWCSRWFQM